MVMASKYLPSDHTIVVAPVEEAYPLKPGVTVAGLSELIDGIAKLLR
jgi:hypothetical protein